MPSPDEMLIATQQRAARWVEFDVDWYRKTYSIGVAVEDPLTDYLANGQQLGRSPNVFFDEAFYLRSYPDVAAAVRKGAYRSGFDHYCRDGLLTYAPHWLFDPEFYAVQLGSAPAGRTYINGYDHFLCVGCGDGITGHPLFDPKFYRMAAGLRGDTASEYADFVHRIHEQRSDVETSLYFDVAWYRANYASAASAIAAGEYLCALHHYLCNDNPTAFDPLADFSEADYLNRYPDVAEAVTKGLFRNGYMHFLRSGVFELRNPSRYIDLRSYWDHNDAARRALRAGIVRDAFAHVLTTGRRKARMKVNGAPVQNFPEQHARELFAAQARDLLPLYGRRPIDFTISGPPACSAIMVLQNELHLTLQAIASLRQNYPGDIELILVDPGSTDDVRLVERYVVGAKLMRFTDDIGFVTANNVVLGSVTTDRLLYLASDVRLAPGAVVAALARLDGDPDIGAVGGKIIGSDSVLHEAGAIVWRNGSTIGYMSGATPLCPEAGFVRDVDFCSIACLMVRTALVRRLGGLDTALMTEHLAAADLGLRIRQSGYRVVYDPSVMLHRYASNTIYSDNMQDKHEGQRTALFNKHSTTLRLHYAASLAHLAAARTADRRHRRVLFIEDRVPLRTHGSNYLRANDIIRVMAALDYQVTVFPMEATEADSMAIAADFPDTVEVLHDRTHSELRAFLASRSGYYDAIWISRITNLDRIHPVLLDTVRMRVRTRIILDTEVLTATQAKLRTRDQLTTEALLDAVMFQFRNALCCQKVLASNEQEACLLADVGVPRVHVLGTMRDVTPTLRPWQKRSGMLFLGDLSRADAPDLDALYWFVDKVLPLIELELGYETQLTVVSHLSPWVTLERITANSRVVLMPPPFNLGPLYDSHRIAVAPTGFETGAPYKVYEAASFGVPVVTTSLMAERMGWTDDRELLAVDADDPSGFAAKVVMLDRTEALWNRLRRTAMARLRRDNGRDAFAQKIRSVLPAHGSRDAGRRGDRHRDTTAKRHLERLP